MRNYYRCPYYRSNTVHPICPPPPQLFSLPCKKKNTPKKKLNFKSIKKDTCTSLNEVENFLCDFSTFVKYIKLYKLLK